MKHTFVLCIAISLIWRTYALTCYSCNEINSGSCFNITSSTSEFVGRCMNEGRSLDTQSNQQTYYDDRTIDDTDTRASMIRCVEYRQFHYLRNTTEIFRGCMLRENADTVCQSMANNGYLYFYNLTRCRTCNEDLCNLAYRNNMGTFTFIAAILTISLTCF